MPVSIHSAFPGGNIVVEAIKSHHVYLHQDLRDTDRDWFYWCFDITGAAGMVLNFHFTQSRALGVRGPAYSADKGHTWQWAGADAMPGDGQFRFTFGEDQNDLRFSFAMSYQLADWERFVSGLAGNALFSVHELCVTNKGRTAPYALLGNGTDHRIVLTARHHACEMMVNYSLEGLITWVLSAGSPDAEWLGSRCSFLIVPFADVDGVENGDQGKGRTPRDHGRDYLEKSLYAETAAIRKLVPEWGREGISFAMDLHCPWIAGKHNEDIYLVGAEDPVTADRQRKFSALLEQVRSGPLPFCAGYYLPFGTDWNTGGNYSSGKSPGRWFRELPGIMLGTSIEVPYANAGGAEVNQATARRFGQDLAVAIARYLKISS